MIQVFSRIAAANGGLRDLRKQGGCEAADAMDSGGLR